MNTLEKMMAKITESITAGNGRVLMSLTRRDQIEDEFDVFVFYLAARSIGTGRVNNAARAALRAIHRIEMLDQIFGLREKTIKKDKSIIEHAKLIMASYPRQSLPDWVEIIANGDPDHIDDVIEIALDDIEEGKNASN